MVALDNEETLKTQGCQLGNIALGNIAQRSVIFFSPLSKNSFASYNEGSRVLIFQKGFYVMQILISNIVYISFHILYLLAYRM